MQMMRTALSLFNRPSRRRDQILALDLGTRATKAVYLQAKGSGYVLANYVILEAPIYEKSPSPELLGEHLKKVVQDLGGRTKQVVLAVAAADSLLRQLEMPLIPVADLRMMLQLNTKNYLQQDLPDHVFDCYVLPPSPNTTLPPSTGKESTKGSAKCRVMVGGAKRQTVRDLQAAARAAGLTAEIIVPSLIGPANALESAEPEVFQKEVVAAVDLGFRNSTISIICNGELTLSRVVGMGGDRLTGGLSELMNISYAEAEGIKVGMPQEVETALQPLLMPLGRELRVSIDFFEKQHDKTVSQVFISGAAAQSTFLIQALQTELMVPCKTWNPLSFLEIAVPPERRVDLDQVSSQLAVVMGAAVAAFS